MGSRFTNKDSFTQMFVFDNLAGLDDWQENCIMNEPVNAIYKITIRIDIPKKKYFTQKLR